MDDTKRNERLTKMQQVADALLEKLRIRVESTDPQELNPQAAKHISATLKDIRDIQLLGQQEQTDAVTVTLDPELEVYSG